MSGHVIATPMLMPALQSLAPVFAGIAAGMGGTCAGIGLAISVKRIIDLQAAAAIEHQLGERNKLNEWVAFQLKQQLNLAELQNLELAFQESERRLTILEMRVPAMAQSKTSWAGPDTPAARSSMALGKDRATPEQVAGMIEDLGRIVSALPREFRGAKDSPYVKLVRHHDAMAAKFKAGDRILLSELTAFKETISRTLGDFRAEVSARREHMQAIGKRLETCLNEVLFYEHFAASPRLKLEAEHSELSVLRGQVTSLLGSPEVNAGAVEVFEKKLSALKSAIDKQVVYSAHRQQLPQSLVAHLTAMGYELIEDFCEDEGGSVLKSALRIPGGEQLHVALHHNGQMAFEVAHERDAPYANETRLTWDEAVFLERQEQRWCRDMRELVRRLSVEGFPFGVDFEQSIPSGSVKVVVVETPEEILAHAEDDRYREEAKRKYLA